MLFGNLVELILAWIIQPIMKINCISIIYSIIIKKAQKKAR